MTLYVLYVCIYVPSVSALPFDSHMSLGCSYYKHNECIRIYSLDLAVTVYHGIVKVSVYFYLHSLQSEGPDFAVDVAAILEDFKVIGNGIVSSVEVLNYPSHGNC